MKDATQKLFSRIQKTLPRWSGADVSHTADRDWYVVLILASILGLGLVTVGVIQYQTTAKVIEEDVDALPVQGLPATEASIDEVWEMYRVRQEEYDAFIRQAPEAPRPSDTKDTIEETPIVPEVAE